MPPKSVTPWKRWHTLLFAVIVIALSYLTFFHRYWEPQAVFWDENYHIASAQKYLHEVYFMEQHPPLGKLLIALGEVIFHPNEQTDQFIGTDYGTGFEEFNFVGYRFFSALSGWATALVFFFIFLTILRNPLQSALLSFIYIFDNALIVHLRGAMLEGPLVLFVSLTFLFFLLLLRDHERTGRLILWSALFGISFAAALTTKVLALFLVLLFIPLLWVMLPHWKRIGGFLLGFSLPFLLMYCTVWEVHFALGKTINPDLPDQGFYQASEEYKGVIASGHQTSLAAFPVMLRDSLKYVTFYNAGAPRLDLCKEDENGSPVYFWPFGARTISYRWETPDGEQFKYLYLVPNPASWWIALFSLFLACAMLLASVLFPPRKALKHRFLLCVFLGLYFAFMWAISRIDRVLYLYHYFTPLSISFIVFGLVFDDLQSFGRRALGEHGKTALALVIAGLVFLSHQFFRPLTYYEPLTDAQVTRRNISSLWELHCANCPNNSGLVVPTRPPPQE